MVSLAMGVGIAGVALLVAAAGLIALGARSLRADPTTTPDAIDTEGGSPGFAELASTHTILRDPHLSADGVSAASRVQAFLDDVLEATFGLRSGDLRPDEWEEELEHLGEQHFVASPEGDLATMLQPLVDEPFEPLVSGVMEGDDDAQAGVSHGGVAPHLDIRLRRGLDGWRIVRIATVDTDPLGPFSMLTPMSQTPRTPRARNPGAALRPLRDALACFQQGVVLDIGMLPIPGGTLAVAPLPGMLWIHRYLPQFDAEALRVRAAATDGTLRAFLISVPGGLIARWTPADSADRPRQPVEAGQVVAFSDPITLAEATAWKVAHAMDGREDQSLWLGALDHEGDALLCRLPTNGYVGYIGSEADGKVVALLVVPTGSPAAFKGPL